VRERGESARGREAVAKDAGCQIMHYAMCAEGGERRKYRGKGIKCKYIGEEMG
jgi:hypothetical protein